MNTNTIALAVAAAIAAFAAGTVRAQSGIIDPGTLNGGEYSSANGVSADGAVVVGWAEDGADCCGSDRAFRWTQGAGMVSLGTLNGGSQSWAYGVSADGAVVVGEAEDGAANGRDRAFRWTQGTGMVSLGTLNGGRSSSANGVSADGAVVVGSSEDGAAGGFGRAFRWTQGTGMVSLGTLNGGRSSSANGVSADGAVVVGWAGDGAANEDTRAFRWTQGAGMVSLGTLNGGSQSRAYGVSADGAVVVGEAGDGAAGGHDRAFRWTQGAGMVSLGTLNGGQYSSANGVSADGAVVVGRADDGAANGSDRAFRWTQGAGMQTVEDWLRTNGVTVPADVTSAANATNSDGSVVVGELESGRAFIARVSAIGSGLITLADVQESLYAAHAGGSMALRVAGPLIWNGAHSRPLARRVAAGRKAFWLAGDWGTDDHGSRNGDLGLAEAGIGYNFGRAQVNVSLGQTWARQSLTQNGRAKADGTYLLAEALIPVSGSFWATLGGYGHRGSADLRRGYLNAGLPDASTGRPDVDTWGLRARLDWDNACQIAGADFSPYADLGYSKARLKGYTETGGGFPARFDARQDKTTELRLGVNAARPLAGGMRLVGTLEAAHRLERNGDRTSGRLIGLFGFDLAGRNYERNWLRAGAGIEGGLGGGVASLTLNATTKGEMPNAWLAANWQMAF